MSLAGEERVQLLGVFLQHPLAERLQRGLIFIVDDQKFGGGLGQSRHVGEDGVLHEDEGAVAPHHIVVAPGLHQHPAVVVGLDVEAPAGGLGEYRLHQLQGNGLGEDGPVAAQVVDDPTVEGGEVAPRPGEAQPPGLLPGADQGAACGDDHLVSRSQGRLDGGTVAGGDLFLVVEQGAVQIQKQGLGTHMGITL